MGEETRREGRFLHQRGSVRLLVIPIALSAHAGCLPVQPGPAALDAIPSLFPVSDPDLEVRAKAEVHMRLYRAVIYIRFFDGRSGSLA